MTISWTQLQAWRQYAQLEPFGEERADLRVGYAAAKLATYHGAKRVKVSDFIPQYEPKSEPTPQERQASFASIKAGAIKYAGG